MDGVTIEQAAKELGIDEDRLYQMARDGQLEYTVIGREAYVERELVDLVKQAQESRRAAASAPKPG